MLYRYSFPIFNSLLSIYIGLLFSFSVQGANQVLQQDYGWEALPDTALIDVCPENNFAGFDYSFKSKCKNITLAWSGGAYDAKNDRMYIWGGGHNDYYGNEIYALDLNLGKMLRLTDPAPLADPHANPAEQQLSPYDGTQPNSRHTYDGLAYIEHAEKLWAYSGGLAAKVGGKDQNTWLFDPNTNEWSLAPARGDIPKIVSGAVSAYDPISGKVFLHDRHGFYSYEYDDQGGKYELLNSQGQMGLGVTAEIDPVNRKMIIVGNSQHIVYDLRPESGYARADYPSSGDGEVFKSIAAGLAYNSKIGRIYSWFGNGKVYSLDPETMQWEGVAYKNEPQHHVSNGTFGRFIYSAKQDAFYVYNQVNYNAYSLRTTDIDDVSPPSAPSNIVYSHPYPDSIKIEWSASDDNLGVAGYRVYVNGTMVEELSGTIFKSMSLDLDQEDVILIRAFDSAGNVSPASSPLSVEPPTSNTKFRLGDCDKETQLNDRDDVIFCESFDSVDWWKNNGYLSDPIVDDPRPLAETHVSFTEVTSEGCISGNCLKANMLKGKTRSLSAYWPLSEANAAPQNLYLRYYLKLADDWDVKMCNVDGDVVGAGGKFPGIADVRTWADPGGQCGNGGSSGDGKNCWSMRAVYRDCGSGDGQACNTKPNAATRFGSYIYHKGQSGSTGDAGYWDNDDWGQSKGNGGTCGTTANNMYCGKGDGGVLERGLWYRIEMQVKMNTPGLQDGIIRGWVNGELNYEKVNTEFRDMGHDFLHNRLIWLNIFKGGVQGNCETSSVLIDQMVVALDKPIGGLDDATLLPPTLSLTVDTATPATDEGIEITWNSQAADSCTASGLWTGQKALSGTESLAITESGILRLDCEGAGGTAAKQVEILLNGVPIDDGVVVEPSTFLTQPDGLTLQDLNEDSLTFSWLPADEDENIVSYNIYLMNTLIGESNSPEFTHSTVIHGVSVEYSVASVDNQGNISIQSEPLEVFIPAKAGTPENEFTLLPTADANLNSTTTKNLGGGSSMDIASNAHGLLHFPIELLPSELEIEQATLSLTSTAEYGNVTLAVFALDKAWQEKTVTRDYANNSIGSRWLSSMGDYRDINDDYLGDSPYGSAELIDDDIPNVSNIDVTALVKRWNSQEINNFGMLLKAMSGVNHRFSTKESSDVAAWPKLTIKTKEALPPLTLTVTSIAEDLVALNWNEPTNMSEGDKFLVYVNGASIAETTKLRYDHAIDNYSESVEFAIALVNSEGSVISESNLVTYTLGDSSTYGGVMDIVTLADTSLNRSTVRNLGNDASIEVASNSHTLIQFDLSFLPADITISKAELILQSTAEYGDLELGVFAVQRSWSEYGATRQYADKYTGAQWQNNLGDWTDVNGVLNGPDEYVSQWLVDDNEANQVNIEITELVRQWQESPETNFGVFLRSLNNRSHKFASKEHKDETLSPKIQITFN